MVIAYDCRRFSDIFAKLCAEIFAANGIKVYIFESLRLTPELSFAIRQLKASGGINITASHNPKQYNGYKVYWEDGAQVMSDIADDMANKIKCIDIFEEVHRVNFQTAINNGMIKILSSEMDKKYLNFVQSLSIRKGKELDRNIKIVYTPLNRAGSDSVKRILKD